MIKKIRAFAAAAAISGAIAKLRENDREAEAPRRIRRLEKKLKAKLKAFSSEKIWLDAIKEL